MLSSVSGIDQLTLSKMAGHQLPWLSMVVPLWLVILFVVSGLCSILCTALFLRFVWQPRTRFLLESERANALPATGGVMGKMIDAIALIQSQLPGCIPAPPPAAASTAPAAAPAPAPAPPK